MWSGGALEKVEHHAWDAALTKNPWLLHGPEEDEKEVAIKKRMPQVDHGQGPHSQAHVT